MIGNDSYKMSKLFSGKKRNKNIVTQLLSAKLTFRVQRVKVDLHCQCKSTLPLYMLTVQPVIAVL